jgi:hypothetical protein
MDKNGLRKSVAVSVPHQVSLSSEEVDRIIENRLAEMAKGIVIDDSGVVSYHNVIYTYLKDSGFLIDPKKSINNAGPLEYELCISLLAHQLYWALQHAKGARPPL